MFRGPVQLKKKSKPTEPESKLSIESILSIEGLADSVSLFLPTPHLPSFAASSSLFKKIHNDPLIWKERYCQTFKEAPFKGDYKAQYAAGSLYSKILKSKREDQTKVFYKQLKRVISAYPDKAWSSFYWGCVYWEDTIYLKGFPLLKKALMCGNRKAAHYLVDKIYDNTQVEHFFLERTNLKEQKKLFSTLWEDFHEHGQLHVAMFIGYLYQRGLGVEKSRANAEKWYKYSSVHHPKLNAAANLVKLYLHPIHTREEIDACIQQMEQIYIEYPSGDLACAIAKLYLEIINIEFAIGWLEEAILKGFTGALLEIAQLHLSEMISTPNNTEIGLDFLLQAFHQGEYGLAEDITQLMDQIEYKGAESPILILKTAYLRGNNIAAGRELSERCLKDISWHENPNVVWWVQVAAFNGCTRSLRALKKQAREGCSFSKIAMAILSHFEVEKTSGWTPVKDVELPDLHLYKEAGRSEGLYENYFDLLLDNVIKKTVDASLTVTPK